MKTQSFDLADRFRREVGAVHRARKAGKFDFLIIGRRVGLKDAAAKEICREWFDAGLVQALGGRNTAHTGRLTEKGVEAFDGWQGDGLAEKVKGVARKVRESLNA